MAHTIAELAEKVRSGTVSAIALTEKTLENADRYSNINAFITLDKDGAMKEATRIDNMVAEGVNPGRLAGVPLVVKDNINVEGVRTTAGTPGIDYIAKSSAPIVSRLQSEGAIIIGKTNMHELAFGVTSNNAAFGAVHNPADITRIPGGSSGGTGSAVAAGIVLGGLGTDTAGSVRVPAALTGVVGFRPTTRLIKQEGIVPSVPTFDVAGPMTRTVTDVSLLNEIVAGQNSAVFRDISGVRLGLAKSYFENISKTVSSAINLALSQIEQAGAELVEIDVTKISQACFEVGYPIGFYEMKCAMVEFLKKYQPDTSLEELVARIASADVKNAYDNGVLGENAPTETVYRQAIKRIEEIKKDYLNLFESHHLDAVIFPTVPLEAPHIRGSDNEVILNGERVPTTATFMRNVASTGVCGAPGLSIPIRSLENDVLPVGLEIDGLPERDVALISIGLGIESILTAS